MIVNAIFVHGSLYVDNYMYMPPEAAGQRGG